MKLSDGTPIDLKQWRKQWSHPPTPIPANATGLWYSEECVDQMLADYAKLAEERARVLREALTRLRDCDWVISLPDRMDAVRDIARAALATPAPEQPAQKEKRCAKCKGSGMVATSNGSSICPCSEGWDNNDEG